eukprot:TRINITY_DN777836_c0_g1_i1.p1 TRINITY_DN777836_c0_g1~~TRINITY_DN777836_c0_g1_i1.p1  ORF type:complete len:223 (+),score=53.75 TRINITY_DN777836_c0_g1_i1:68-736(+)
MAHNFDHSSEAGRLLSKIYGRPKVEIKYPKLKTRKSSTNTPFVPGGGKREHDPRKKTTKSARINYPKKARAEPLAPIQVREILQCGTKKIDPVAAHAELVEAADRICKHERPKVKKRESESSSVITGVKNRIKDLEDNFDELTNIGFNLKKEIAKLDANLNEAQYNGVVEGLTSLANDRAKLQSKFTTNVQQIQELKAKIDRETFILHQLQEDELDQLSSKR